MSIRLTFLTEYDKINTTIPPGLCSFLHAHLGAFCLFGVKMP